MHAVLSGAEPGSIVARDTLPCPDASREPAIASATVCERTPLAEIPPPGIRDVLTARWSAQNDRPQTIGDAGLTSRSADRPRPRQSHALTNQQLGKCNVNVARGLRIQ